MKNVQARAKTIILNWFDEGPPEPQIRRRLSAGIDLLFIELAKRETWSECRSIILGDASSPRFCASGQVWQARPCQIGLTFSSVGPDWRLGWGTIFRDEYTHEILSWLAHYACQYVHRSYVAKALMIAWEQHGVILQPFGSESIRRRYGDLRPSASPKEVLREAIVENDKRWGPVRPLPARSTSAWRRRNTFDPAIHEGIFHFLRGQSLLKAEFELEALVAFDCAIQSLQKMDWSRMSRNAHRSRTELCAAMGFKERTAVLAEHIYFLRNNFVAHAGGWRWWDGPEYVDDDFLHAASNFTLRALRRAADLEPQMRKINPSPFSWSDWFLLHFRELWSAIWFRDPLYNS